MISVEVALARYRYHLNIYLLKIITHNKATVIFI